MDFSYPNANDSAGSVSSFNQAGFANQPAQPTATSPVAPVTPVVAAPVEPVVPVAGQNVVPGTSVSPVLPVNQDVSRTDNQSNVTQNDVSRELPVDQTSTTPQGFVVTPPPVSMPAGQMPDSPSLGDAAALKTATDQPVKEEEKKNSPLQELAEKIASLKSEFIKVEEDAPVTPPVSEVTPAPMPAPMPTPAENMLEKVEPRPVVTDQVGGVQQLDNSISNTVPSAAAPSPVAPTVPVEASVEVSPVNDIPLKSKLVEIDTSAPLPEYSKPKGKKYPFTVEQLLDMVVERNASDLHVTVGYPAMIRVDGSLVPVSNEIVTVENVGDLILPVLKEEKRDRLEVNREVDLAYAHGEKGRFRINAFYQKQSLAAAFRLIPTKIRTIDELNLPPIYHQLTKLGQGLVLVTGPTGHGKSTTLAAIIQEINMTRSAHILTIEDPIEYVFPQAKAMVAQREIQDDTHSWEIALKSALREDPNVILVGEMRDYETIAAAITLAETGHLVFATLHTNSCAQTIDRIIDVFPENQQPQVRSQLSNIIEAVIAQRLVPVNGGGRRAVSEIMLANAAVRNLIREAKTHQLDNVIRTSVDVGMISLEHSLVKLVRDGQITMERAQEFSVRPEEIVRLLKG